jgi:hypothetical protein
VHRLFWAVSGGVGDGDEPDRPATPGIDEEGA